MEFNRPIYLRAAIVLGFFFLFFPLDSFAACDEEVYRQSQDHIYIEGTCNTVEAADEACIAFKVSHNYPPTTCNHAFYENIVWAGWLFEDGSNSLPFYLGQFYFSTTRIAPNKNAGAPPCPDACFGDPVNAGTGNKFETHGEYRGEGSFPLELSWTYNSQQASKYTPDAAMTFGRNRNHSYSSRVTHFPAATVPLVYVTRSDGKVMRFKKSGNSWVADADNGARLVSLMQAGNIVGWELEDEQRSREVFDSVGRLTKAFDSAGHQHVVNYNEQGRISTVTDVAGRALVFEYDAVTGDPVAHILLPDGNRLHFFYSSSNDLTRVTYPGGSSIEYRYNEAGLVTGSTPQGSLTGVIDESEVRYSSTRYGDKARATSTYLGNGLDSHSAIYQMAPGDQYASQATVTLPGGAQRQMEFSVVQGVVLAASATTSCADCISKTTTYTYDPNGRADVVVTSGVSTDYDYGPSGLLVQKIEAANDSTGNKRTTQTDWDSSLRVPTERRTLNATNALVAKANWTYNTRGQALTQTQTDPVTSATRTTTTAYCEQADITAGTRPLLGLIQSFDGPRTDVNDITTYTYYLSDPSMEAACAANPANCSHRKGDLWKVTNALGHVTETLKYDGAGRVLSVKDANSVVTDMEYHPRGWLTARKVRGPDPAVETDGQITRIEYWPTGLVKKVTQPDGAFTSYTYDAAHRLTDITDASGNSIHYTLDNAGNKIKEDTKDAQGALRRTLSRVYNQLGQLQTQKDASQNPTGFVYDANGNVDTVTDALTHVTDNDYDPLNRLKRSLQDIGGIEAETKFDYDALDHLTKVTDPKGLDTHYVYNGLGDLTQLRSPDTGTTDYTYDSAGNRKTQTDARGITNTYTYDALNRPKTIAYSDGSVGTSYAYDVLSKSPCIGITGAVVSVGRLNKITDVSGSTRYCYDRFGHLVGKRQSSGAELDVSYAYNLAGQLTKITYPNSLVVDYVRDAQGRTIEVGVKPSGGARQVLLNQITYHPFGPVASWTYGMSGRTMQRPLNQDYQPLAIADASPGGLSLGYEFNAVGNLTRLHNADQSALLARYDYDALNRLIDVKDGPTGTPIEHYDYDDTGNRTSLTTSAGTTPYVYPATSHRLDSVGAIARAYDAVGNTTTIGGTAKEFVYSGNNRMQQVKQNGVATMTYAYNGKGEQVRRTAGAASTYTIYDEAGHWLGDYSGSTTALQNAIWLDDLPVGLIANNQLHYIEPDHLGTPRVVIDPVRNVAVWKWELTGEAFGNTLPNQDPDADGTAFVFNMRFPGQRYDAASGLNYNYFRDYEPNTGRYLESDPFGLRGGVSTYAYVSGKPLSTIDPSGMVGCDPGKDCSCNCGWSVSGDEIQLGFGAYYADGMSTYKCKCKGLSCRTRTKCFGGGAIASVGGSKIVKGWVNAGQNTSCKSLGGGWQSLQLTFEVDLKAIFGCGGTAPMSGGEGSVSCGAGVGFSVFTVGRCYSTVLSCNLGNRTLYGNEL